MTQTEKILEALEQGPVTTHQLLGMYIGRYGARINDLRKDGYKIRSRLLTKGNWEYTLEDENE